MERCITSIVPPLRLPIPRVYIYIAFISYSRLIHPHASTRSHLAAFEKEGAFEEKERERERKGNGNTGNMRRSIIRPLTLSVSDDRVSTATCNK